jgi:hypothetical protein
MEREKRRERRREGGKKREVKTEKGEKRGLRVCLASSSAACHRWEFLAPV